MTTVGRERVKFCTGQWKFKITKTKYYNVVYERPLPSACLYFVPLSFSLSPLTKFLFWHFLHIFSVFSSFVLLVLIFVSRILILKWQILLQNLWEIIPLNIIVPFMVHMILHDFTAKVRHLISFFVILFSPFFRLFSHDFNSNFLYFWWILADTAFTQLKLNEVGAWINRRNVHPVAIAQAFSRGYQRFMARNIRARYASPWQFFFQSIAISSTFFYFMYYPKCLCKFYHNSIF